MAAQNTEAATSGFKASYHSWGPFFSFFFFSQIVLIAGKLLHISQATCSIRCFFRIKCCPGCHSMKTESASCSLKAALCRGKVGNCRQEKGWVVSPHSSHQGIPEKLPGNPRHPQNSLQIRGLDKRVTFQSCPPKREDSLQPLSNDQICETWSGLNFLKQK